MSFLEKVKQQKLFSIALLLITLAVGIVIGTLVNTGVKADKSQTAIAPDATPLTVPRAVPIANEFTKLTKRLEPSVVYIESDYLPKPGKRTAKKESGEDEDSNTDSQKPKDPSEMFRRFFGGGSPDSRSFRSEGTGTGFVVDRNGYIITNHHVIEKADRIKVRMAGDESEHRGRVIGYDPETDVAVIKIDTKEPLVPVVMGNSDSVQVGDWVIAIGSPFGLQATVTAGIVSAERTPRDLPGAGQFQSFLQTDAAINPGNSGGPLLNTRGEVIGVNTMIATRSGSYEGIGFALPSNMAVKVYNDIIREGRVVRGSIGVTWSRSGSANNTLRAFGIDHGVLIETVSEGGPAAKAGVKPDDVIVAMDGRAIKDGEELVNRVAERQIGSTANFTVDRDGKRLDLRIGVEDRTEVWKNRPDVTEGRPPQPAPQVTKPVAPAKFGMTIGNLTPKERQDLQIQDKTGVKVVAVDPGSFADDIGMTEGDAILSINRTDVHTPDDVIRVQGTFKPGQPVAVHIVRNGGPGVRRGSPLRTYLSGRVPED